MKFKIKISAIDHGKVVRFNHTIEGPEFEPKSHIFLGRELTESVEEQQDEWLIDNWHLVVAACEERDLYPIINAVVIPSKSRVNKKAQVVELLGEVAPNLHPEHLALVVGTLNDMWPIVKKMSPEKILLVVFESVNVTLKVNTSILKDLMKTITGGNRPQNDTIPTNIRN